MAPGAPSWRAATSGPIEYLTALALRHDAALIRRSTAILSQGLAAAQAFFERHDALFTWIPPQAGVVTFPRWLGPGGTKALSDRLLAEASIALAPSLCFDAGDKHVRLGLGQSGLADGLAAFERFLSQRL